MKGKTVKVIHYESALRRENAGPLGLTGEVVWDEGGDEVVVAFGQAVGNGGSPTGQKNQAWVYRDWLEELT